MASDADLLLLSQAVNNIPYGSAPTAPTGWSLVSPPRYDPSGMMAAAFKSNNNSEVVIAYQSTNLNSGSTTWRDTQVATDKQIAQGLIPAAYGDALTFAQAVIAQNPGAPISVVGFSLGGAEAQFVASNTGFGGASYGGPGISGYTYNPINANFRSWINYGDTIATWGGTHVGQVEYIGNPLFAVPALLGSLAGRADWSRRRNPPSRLTTGKPNVLFSPACRTIVAHLCRPDASSSQ